MFAIRETKRRLEHGAAVKLLLDPPGRKDRSSFPEMATSFTVRLYPNYILQNGHPATATRDLVHPVAVVDVHHPSGITEEVTALLNQWVPAGDLLLNLKGVTRWARLEVEKDAGRFPLFLALVVGLFGLLWRVGLSRAYVDVVAEPDGQEGYLLHLGGRADYTRQPFATEMLKIADQIEAKVHHG